MEMGRNKKKKNASAGKNTAVLSVSLFLLIMVNGCVGGLKDFVVGCMRNYLENRTLQAGYLEGEFDDSEVRTFIEGQEGVLACFNYDDYFGLRRLSLDGEPFGGSEKAFIHAEPYSADVMEPYMESRIDGLADDEIIVGKYTNVSAYGIVDVKTGMEITDMEPYIGKTLTGTIRKSEEEGKEYSFRIVGVFDNRKAGQPGVCYISDHVRQEMLDFLDFHMSAVDEYGREEKSYMIYFQAIAEDMESITALRESLRREFPGIITLYPVNFPAVVFYFLEGMVLAGNFIVFFFVFNSISNVVYVSEDNVYKRRREFGILKAIGWRDRDIRNLLLKESLASSGKAVCLSALAGLAAFGIFRWHVLHRMNLYFVGLTFSVRPHLVLFYFLTAFGVPLAGFWRGYRCLAGMTAAEALHSE